jgi:glycosyltransferase involved in cell wall biosynthesis
MYLCLDPGVSLEPGAGASVHAVSMIEAMRDGGADVVPVGAGELLAGVADGRVWSWLAARPRGRRYVNLVRRNAVERPAAAKRVAAAIERHRPDVVYERTSLFFDVGGRAARRAGVPLVLEVNAPLAWEAAHFRGERMVALAARQERRAWRLARRVTAVSRDLVERVRASGQGDVVHVPNAVDHERFHPGVAADGDLAARLQGTFAVAFSGTLKPWHDLPTLLRALSIVRRTTPCTLVVIGDGPGRAALEREAQRLEVPLVVTGRVDHERVPALAAAADACVALLHPDPQLQYFSPLKATEYLALGKPTVVADAGDLAELVRRGAAVGYRPGSAEDLAAALLRVASDPDVGRTASERGQALARDMSWRQAAEESLRGIVA